MTDTRSVRRTAEKAARKTLAGTMVGAIGELAVALTAREDSASALAEAKARGDELLAAARLEAACLISQAEEGAAQSSDQYKRAWQAARETGWTAPQLRAMGYKHPAPSGRRDGHRPGTSKPIELTTGTPDASTNSPREPAPPDRVQSFVGAAAPGH